MALHRDIFWVGRQWAVTGFGVQAVDQRLKGAFDIEVARLWDDDLPQRMRALAWLNADDFDKALRAARSRFPEPPRNTLPLVESVLELMSPAASVPPTENVNENVEANPEVKPRIALLEADAPSRESPQPAVMSRLPKSAANVPREPAAVDAEPSLPKPLVLRIDRASAKFLPRWRVRH